MPTGVVLAGGRSTRFGDRDKALVSLAGTPMVRRVADRLPPVVDELVVNCRPEQVGPLETALEGLDPTFAPDDRPGAGPLAGIERGLRAASGEYAAVVACDMPFLDPHFLGYLFGRARDRDAAVPRPDEWYQPLQAVYRVEPALAACRDAHAAGEARPVALRSRLDAVTVGPAELDAHAAPATFENLNTPAELAAARERFE
jgi:molybdopterin-guanine dinucleotide biosynthesis protein A